MNTAKLRPIDARVMKPGDPVVRSDGLKGRFHSIIDEADPSHKAVILWDNGVVHAYALDGKMFETSCGVSVFLPPDPDPIDPSPGNVDKLRRSQVGEGWRIVEHGEKPDRRAQVWSQSHKWVSPCDPFWGRAYAPASTYRVPIAPIKTVPLSMEDFIGKPWPLVRVMNGSAMRAILNVEEDCVIVPGRQPITYEDLRGMALSWDHGKTWVKAEKEEQA